MKKRIALFVLIYLVFLIIPAQSHDADIITIVAVGDLYLGGSANNYLKQNGYSYPFEYTKNILHNADIAMANLEAPLTNRTDAFMEKEFVLKHSPDAVGAIKNAGFDVLTLANNHIMDYGPAGLQDTMSILDKAGIKHTGAGKNSKAARTPVIVKIKNKKIAFLAYSLVFPEEYYATDDSSGTAQGVFDNIKSDIKNISKHADIIIISFHWGEEKMKYPKEYQVQLAHLAIDNGASLVIGHHPHVIQGVEKYKNGLIFYSLGNFVFGSFGQAILERPEGMIALLSFSQNGVISGEIIPLNVDNRDVLFQPKPLHSEKFDAAIKNIQEISSRFQVKLDAKAGKGSLRFNDKLSIAHTQK